MIQRAVEAFSKGELLNEFVPVPGALKETMAGSYGDSERQALLEAQTEINLKVYGYGNWYDFCVNEWGTKWDVGGDDGITDYEEGSTSASFTFDSAWSPPINAYEKLEALGFDVEGYYYEPGMAFVGVYRNGYDECYDYSGTNSRTVRDAVGEELDDYWCISESMAEWESEEPDELQEWYEEGVEKLGLEPHDKN
jgi:hypothetical protein